LTKCFFCNILLSLRITVLPISGGAKRDVIAKGAWGCVYGFGWSKDVVCVVSQELSVVRVFPCCGSTAIIVPFAESVLGLMPLSL